MAALTRLTRLALEPPHGSGVNDVRQDSGVEAFPNGHEGEGGGRAHGRLVMAGAAKETTLQSIFSLYMPPLLPSSTFALSMSFCVPLPAPTPSSPAHLLPFQHQACRQAPPTQRPLVALSWAAVSAPAGRETPMPGARLGETAAAPGGPADPHPGTADPVAGAAGGSGQRATARRAAGARRRVAAGGTRRGAGAGARSCCWCLAPLPQLLWLLRLLRLLRLLQVLRRRCCWCWALQQPTGRLLPLGHPSLSAPPLPLLRQPPQPPSPPPLVLLFAPLLLCRREDWGRP